VEKDDYLPAFEKALKSHAKSANIPGFRKGMVPSGVIKKLYGKEILNEEVVKVLENQLYNFMKGGQSHIFGQPLPLNETKINFDPNQLTDYEFSFEIGLKPEINIDVKNIQVTRYKIEVSDETINEEVKYLRIKNGKKEDVEAIGKKEEDIIDVDFQETDEDGNDIEDGLSDTLKDITMDTFSDAAFDLLNGKKKDETIVIQLNKAFEGENLEGVLDDLGYEFDDDETAEKFVKITIDRIHQLQIAPIDETLFEAVYPNQEIKTEEEFRAKQRSEFDVLFTKRATTQLHDQIYHYLLEHTQVELPEEFLIRWLQVGSEKEKSAEEAEKAYPNFAKSMRWYLISTQLERDFDIIISEEDMKNYARRHIQSHWGGDYSKEEDTSWIDKFAEKFLDSKAFIRDAHDFILGEKLFLQLENHVQIKEEPIGEKDFFEMIRKHDEQHHHEDDDDEYEIENEQQEREDEHHHD
jgi:trigger factor